ncbi:MAG: MFS transporter [Chloroflexi bacterium]|nr:MFS transporter [Chloroflexota bacterium]
MPSARLTGKFFYGWVVVVAVLVIGTLTFGTRNIFGVFFKSLGDEFELSRAATSGILSLYMVLSAVFIVIGGWAVDRYGPRRVVFLMGVFTGLSLLLTSQASSAWQVFVGYGVLFALGSGASFSVLMSVVARWFDRRRAFALGIAGSGGPLGMVALAPALTYLIINFGWRMSFIVVGVVSGVVVMVLSALLKKEPADIGALPDGDRVVRPAGEPGGKMLTAGLSLREAWRRRAFWFMWITWFFQGYVYFLVYTHLVPFATDMGLSPMTAALVFSLLSAVNIGGRLLLGNLSDRTGRGVMVVTSSLFMAASLVWLIWAEAAWTFYLFGALYGLASGGFNPTLAALATDVFGVRNIGVIMGVLNFAFAIGSALGPFIGGLAFDLTESYAIAFATAAGATLMMTLMMVLVRDERRATAAGVAVQS